MANTETEARTSTQISDPGLARGGGSERIAEREAPAEKKTSLRDNLKQNFDKGTKREVKEKSDVGTSLEKKAPTFGKSMASQSTEVTSAPERTPIAPPGDMTAEERAQFSSLTPEQQQYISRRALQTRNDYSRQTAELSEKGKKYEAIDGAITSLSKEYSDVGVTKLINNTAQWDKALKGPSGEAAAREFLSEYGLSHILKDGSEAPQQQNGNANYLTREEAEKLADERVNRKFQEQQNSHLVQQNHSMVQEFMRGKPLFRDPGTAQQLEQELAPVVKALKSQNPNRPVQEILETAYNYVTKGNPTYSGLVSQLDAKTETEATNEKAERAIRASRSISGSPGSGTPKVKYKNLRENLAANFRK